MKSAHLLHLISLLLTSQVFLISQTILVTGGAGYIGSHTSWLLKQEGHSVIILDKFVRNQPWPHSWATVIRGDFGDRKVLHEIFTKHNIETVMHFAASIDVGESVLEPYEYYRNNVLKTLVLLDSMREHKIKNFIFSSTCAVFGTPTTKFVTEDHAKNPISPYAKTKLAIEFALTDYARQGLNSVILRYFNASGACPEHELYAPITHVIDIILDAITHKKTFNVFGNDYETVDGTGIRDYIHVLDIAHAHILAMNYLSKKALIPGLHAYNFNIGTGQGYSVQQLINTAQEITGKSLQVAYMPRRSGDLAYIVADSTKAFEELGWQPRHSTLENILRTTIEAQIKQCHSTPNTH